MAENAQAKLQVELDATDNASPKAREAGGAFRELGSQLQEIGKIAAGFTLGNLGASLGMGLAEHFRDALTEVENFGGAVYNLQQRIGVSSQSASGLLSVFERFGVSADEANRTIDFFTRGLHNNISTVDGGIQAAGAFQQTLAELGVTAVDSTGHFRPVDQVLADVIDRMHAFNADGQTAARAMNLFGRAGADLAPILNLSKQDFINLQDEAAKLGVTLSQQNVDAIRQLYMAHHDLDEAVRGLTIQMGLAFVPVLKEGAQGMADFVASLNADNGKGIKELQSNVENLTSSVRDLFTVSQGNFDFSKGTPTADLDAGLNNAKGSGAAIGQNVPGSGGHGLLGLLLGPQQASRIVDAINTAANHPDQALGALTANGRVFTGAPPPKIASNEPAPFSTSPTTGKPLDFSAAIGRPANLGPAAAADQADRAVGFDNLPGYKAANDRMLSDQERLKQLSIAEAAATREQEIVQQQLNVLNRDDLDLVNARAAAELALLPIKQQQADLEAELLATQKQRQQIDRESALQRAQLAAMPSSAALEDNQYQQQLLQAQIRAGILSGQGIPAGAIQELIAAKRGEAGLEVNALEAGHDVTLAERNQQAGSLQQQLDTADIRKQQADLAAEAAKKQADLDRVNSELQRQQLEKVPNQNALEAQRRKLEDTLFGIHQQQNQLSGVNNQVTVQLTINEATGAADYDKLAKDLAATVLDAIKKAAGRAEAPAPATVPGALGG